MTTTIQISPTRIVRYTIGEETDVINYLTLAGMPKSLLVMVNIQLGILAAVAKGTQSNG